MNSALLMSRRSLLATPLLAATASRSQAQSAKSAPETIPLWPANKVATTAAISSEKRDGDGILSHVSMPRLNCYRPDSPNGTAVIVIAGGGYGHIMAGKESTPTCRWLQSIGITAFELIYRLPEDGPTPLVPFQDGQRAVRIVRNQAANYGISPQRIGLIGFSAGGHLAGMITVNADRSFYPAVDAADAVPARPDFVGLIYPVLTFMPPFDHTHTRRAIVGANPSAAESAAYSVDRLVRSALPPIFLAQSVDDPISPVDNSLLMFNALRAVGSAVELHVFQSGGHGWSLGYPGSEPAAWPALFVKWAEKNGCLRDSLGSTQAPVK